MDDAELVLENQFLDKFVNFFKKLYFQAIKLFLLSSNNLVDAEVKELNEKIMNWTEPDRFSYPLNKWGIHSNYNMTPIQAPLF